MSRKYSPRFGEKSKACLLSVVELGGNATRAQVTEDLHESGIRDGSLHKALNNERIFKRDDTVLPPIYTPTTLGYVVLGEYLATVDDSIRTRIHSHLARLALSENDSI